MNTFRTRTARIALAAVLTLGIAGTGTAAHAAVPAFPQGPTDLVPGGNGPDDPRPEGPGDLTGTPDEPDCPPLLASCDITSDPGDAGDGGNGGNGGEAQVDPAVVATPTFTG
ncbi:MAG: hypothetical protein MUE36_07770 [Acidimicrobiales bacterium]|jgi:hypothetical protein|nr:hypothetical protein [Acidimicrobiales bacterium]